MYTMEYSEDDFLNISGIQHFIFCKRQWALIHIEQQWKENVHTAEGNIFHDNAHNGLNHELRGNTLVTRGLLVASRSLGLNGTCDVVEFRKNSKGIELHGIEGKWIPVPVEYKKGKPKENDSDILQLTAQAVCLEEMLMCDIEKGYLYYGEAHRRTEVVFNDELRCRLKEVTEEMHKYYKRAYTPKVKPSKCCKACSLNEICIPVLCKKQSAREYIDIRLEGFL